MRNKFWPVVVLIAGICVLPASSSPAYAEPDPGDPAPTLTLTTMNGHAYDLAKSRGRVVIVHFWATWCAACRQEMAELDDFNKKYHDKGIDIMAISVDKASKVDEVIDVMTPVSFLGAMIQDVKENGFGMPRILPATYLIDRNGIVRARVTPEDNISMTQILTGKIEVLLNTPGNGP